MIYFTSDTHFYHKHIIDYCKRPFDSVEGMNLGMIERWNARVTNDDIVYFLGDFAFAGTAKSKEIFDRLKGYKHLITGNHDYGAGRKLAWETVRDYALIRPHIEYQNDEGELKQVEHPVILCHFPFISWDGMAHGSWHLHGHCHGSLKDTGALRLDVGVDCHDYAPISLPEIQAKMALRTVVPVDHHKPENRANPA